MKTHILLLASVAAFTLGGAAMAAEKTSYESKTNVARDSKGNYNEESKTEKTNAAGTTTTTKEKVEVDVHANGDVDNMVKSEKTTDPRGLMNKRSTKITDTQDVKHTGATKNTHKKVVDGKTVESDVETSK
jgi:hypothetical protein